MLRRGWLTYGALLIMAVYAMAIACRGSDPADEAAVEGVTEVRLEDFAFAPANIIVEAGTTVTWTNYDSAGHTVTSDESGELGSPTFGRDATFSHTFNVPGEFYYHCEPHPYMKRLVTVREAGANWRQQGSDAPFRPQLQPSRVEAR